MRFINYLNEKLKKHRDGVFRYSIPGCDVFGQIKKINNRKWVAEIRDVETGNLVRNAGEWKSKKEAVEEIQHILKSDYFCEE